VAKGYATALPQRRSGRLTNATGSTSPELSAGVGALNNTAMRAPLRIAFPLLLVLSHVDAQYLITTIAGGGLPRPLTPAVDAPLGVFLNSVAVDDFGNLYFSTNNCVFKLDRSGLLLRVAGASPEHGFSSDGGQATSALLNQPDGIAVDSFGNIFIADSGGGRIRKIATNGVITTVAGGGSNLARDGIRATDAFFNAPVAVTVDADGNLYMVEFNAHRVWRVLPNGILASAAGNGTPGFSGDGGPATAASLSNPTGVAVDLSGNLYIADAGNSRVRKVTEADGTISTVAGNGQRVSSGDGGPAAAAGVSPYGVAVDAARNLYVADSFNNQIRKIGADGAITTIAGISTPGYSGDGGPATSAAITGPNSVAVDRAGSIYIADSGNLRLRKVATNGTMATVAGNGNESGYSGDGGAAAGAELWNPWGVAVDALGNFYIADARNNRIRKVAPDGIMTTIAGNGVHGYSGDGGPATSAAFAYPSGVAVDGAGNVYIADYENNRVRKVALDGTVATVAGTGARGYGGDGGAAANATLSGPIAVAADLEGNVYIADAGNSRIRKIGLDGAITTVAGNGARDGDLGDGGPAVNARLASPYGVAVNAAGNLYIADTSNSRIRRVTPDGIITTVAGNGIAFGDIGEGGPAADASITTPYGVAADDAGNIYFPDLFFVRKVDGSDKINTLAGGGADYSGDGGPAINAGMWGPFGVAVDAAGDVYVADGFTHSVRLLVPTATHAALTIGLTHEEAFRAGEGTHLTRSSSATSPTPDPARA
jgi:sugar lactone lactonase YvrE